MTLLSRVAETARYPTPDTITTLSLPGSGDPILAGGSTASGHGIVYCLGGSFQLRWKQEFPTPVTALGIGESGAFLCAATSDKQLFFFDQAGKLLWKHQNRGVVQGAELNSTGQYAIVRSDDNSAVFFDNNRAGAFNKFAWRKIIKEAPVSDVGIDAPGQNIAIAADNGEVHLYDEKGEFRWMGALPPAARTLAVSREGEYIVVGGVDKAITVLGTTHGNVVWTAPTGGVVCSVGISGRGQIVAAASKDGYVLAYDAKGHPLWRYKLLNPPDRLVVSTDGRCVVVLGIDNTIYALDAKGGLLWRHETQDRFTGLRVPATGHSAVLAGPGGIRIFDHQSVLATLIGHLQAAVGDAKQKGRPYGQADQFLQAAQAAHSQRDFTATAAALRKGETALGGESAQEPEPIPLPPKPAAPAEATGNAADQAASVKEEVARLRAKLETLAEKDVDIDPLASLIEQAETLAAGGKLEEATEFLADASELARELEPKAAAAGRAGQPTGVPVTAPPKAAPPPAEVTATLERATAVLSFLVEEDIEVEAAAHALASAKQAAMAGDWGRADTLAKQAHQQLNTVAENTVTSVLVTVKQLLTEAGKSGKPAAELQPAMVQLQKVNAAYRAKEFQLAVAEARKAVAILEGILSPSPGARAPPPMMRMEIVPGPQSSPPAPTTITIPAPAPAPAPAPRPAAPAPAPPSPAPAPPPLQIPIPVPAPAAATAAPAPKPAAPPTPKPAAPTAPAAPAHAPAPMPAPAPRPAAPAPAPAPGPAPAPAAPAPAQPPPVPSINPVGIDPGFQVAVDHLKTAGTARAGGDYVGYIESTLKANELIARAGKELVQGLLKQVDAQVQTLEDAGAVMAISDLKARAKASMDTGDLRTSIRAIKDARDAIIKAQSENVRRALAETKARLAFAEQINAEVARATALLQGAENALHTGQLDNALTAIRQADSELAEAKYGAISAIVEQSRGLLNQAVSLGVDPGPLQESLQAAQDALSVAEEAGSVEEYENAHTLAKGLLQKFQEAPRSHAQRLIIGCRGPLLNMERQHLDATVAKDLMTLAKAAFDQGKIADAILLAKKCQDETKMGPARALAVELDGVAKELQKEKSQGAKLDTAEALLVQARAALAEGRIDEVKKLQARITEEAGKARAAAAAVVEALYLASQLMDEAAGKGIDVTAAVLLYDEADSARTRDPMKAKELADKAVNGLRTMLRR